MSRMYRILPNVRNHRSWLICGLLVVLAKMAVALTTIGTNDVVTWHHFAESVSNHGALWLYHSDPLFNHPPFMAHGLPLLYWLSVHTPLAFPFWIRLPAILADFGSLLLMALILKPANHLLVLFAICPVSFMVSGFHGNTDAVMVFFILLAIYLTERTRWLYAGAAALAIAACIKVAAIALAPAFLFYLSSNRRRVAFALTSCGVFILLSSPWLIQDPGIIFRNVFGYRSQPGVWGFTRVEKLVADHFHRESHLAAFTRILTFVTVGAVTGLMLVLPRRAASLYGRCALSMFLLLWVLPGFGVQYLSWMVPFALFFGGLSTAGVYASSGFFLFLVYSYWSGGFPWQYADSVPHLGNWPKNVIVFELLAWLTIGMTFLIGLRRCLLARDPLQAASSGTELATESVRLPAIARDGSAVE